MSMSAVLIVSLAAAVVLVVGGGLMMYMSNLVRNAYELKVQINSDLEERFKAIIEDVEKRTKWIKRDMVEELEKIKSTLHQSNSRTIQELADPLSKRLEAMEQTMKKEHSDWVAALEGMTQTLTHVDSKASQIRRDLRRAEDKLGLEPSSASGGLPPKPGDPAAAKASAAPPPPPPPGAASDVLSTLPNL